MNHSYRIALVSDIHGNQIALREVLRAIERRGADEIVCLGDVATLGAAPGEVVDTLQRLGCRCVMGNHDDYMLDPDLIREHTDTSIIIEAIDWCRDRLTAEQIEFNRGFEEGFELPLGRYHRLNLFHGSPSSNMADLLSDTAPEAFDQQLGPDRSAVMAGGHTHIQMLRQHRGSLVINPGSVGAPFREYVRPGVPTILDHAEYACVEVRDGDFTVGLHHVALDRDEMAKATLESGNPMRSALAAAYL